MAEVKSELIFAANIGRLTLKPLSGDRRDSSDRVYWLNKSTRTTKKYQPLRNTEFIIRPVARNTFRILINNERFEEAYSAEEAPISLQRAFDHECIRAGIDSASPKFKTGAEDAMPTSPRRRG